MNSSNARIGQITGMNPYQVQLLGETNPLNVPPVVLATVNTGDYVWCEFVGQQLVVYGRIQDGSVPQLGSTEDLNDLTYTGVWNQPLNANTSTAHHYPSGKAGVLEVFRSESNGNMIMQRFTDYDGIGVWWRIYYSGWGTWDNWVQMGAAKPTWTAMTLTNGWSNYGAGYAPAQYALINGMVHIEGLIKSGTLGSGGYFTLPTGFRPANHIQYTNMSSGGIADCRVFSSGVCCVYALVSGSTASVSITFSFPAET